MLFLQVPPSPPVETTLHRIVETVAYFRATVPSISADESIASDLSQHGLYRAHSHATATLRVFATDPATSLHEVRTYLTLDGKPVKADKKTVLPFELNGAFSNVPETFFTPAHVLCYDFTAMSAAPDGSLQIAFTGKSDLPPACGNSGVTLHGFVCVDPTTGHILHLERTITSPPKEGKHEVTFIAVDYSPVTIGNSTFWLPTRLVANLDGNLGHFTAEYSGFHRFTGSVKILPVEEPGTP